jgi:hypothetical protein
MELDAFFALIPLFGLSVMLIMGVYLLGALNAGNQFCGVAQTYTAGCEDAIASGLVMFGWADKALILIYVAMIVGAIVGALQVQSHPIMFGFTILCCAFTWVIVPYISNIYFSLVNNPELNAAAWTLQGSIAFWNNALFLSVVSCIIIGVVNHGKKQQQGFAWSG